MRESCILCKWHGGYTGAGLCADARKKAGVFDGYCVDSNKFEPVDPKEMDIRDYNIGSSDYAEHTIQPWDIWLEYKLNPWDADIIKRILRNKKGNDRKMDYEKCIHICQERIRQIDNE